MAPKHRYLSQTAKLRFLYLVPSFHSLVTPVIANIHSSIPASLKSRELGFLKCREVKRIWAAVLLPISAVAQYNDKVISQPCL